MKKESKSISLKQKKEALTKFKSIENNGIVV